MLASLELKILDKPTDYTKRLQDIEKSKNTEKSKLHMEKDYLG
jgi:hypothetical protein